MSMSISVCVYVYVHVWICHVYFSALIFCGHRLTFNTEIGCVFLVTFFQLSTLYLLPEKSTGKFQSYPSSQWTAFSTYNFRRTSAWQPSALTNSRTALDGWHPLLILTHSTEEINGSYRYFFKLTCPDLYILGKTTCFTDNEKHFREVWAIVL